MEKYIKKKTKKSQKKKIIKFSKKNKSNNSAELVIKTKPEWIKSSLANKSTYQKKYNDSIKELYDLTSLKDSKKKVSKKLKTISQKEKIKVKAKVQEEYVKEKQDSKKHYEKYLEKVSKK